MSDAPIHDLHARARQVGNWVWCERRLFERLGDWAGTTSDPATAMLFGEMSRRHGWHSELFHDRLPELSSLDAEALVVPPGPATAAFVAALVDDDEPDALRRATAVYRVVMPLLVTQYRAGLASVSAVAEPSLGRWLEIVLRDDLDEWARGVELLTGLVGGVDEVEAASARQRELELLAVQTSVLTR